MLAWRKGFEKMKTQDHLQKLSELGLDDEDLKEFKELEAGNKSLEDELLREDELAEKKVSSKKKNK